MKSLWFLVTGLFLFIATISKAAVVDPKLVEHLQNQYEGVQVSRSLKATSPIIIIGMPTEQLQYGLVNSGDGLYQANRASAVSSNDNKMASVISKENQRMYFVEPYQAQNGFINGGYGDSVWLLTNQDGLINQDSTAVASDNGNAVYNAASAQSVLNVNW